MRTQIVRLSAFLAALALTLGLVVSMTSAQGTSETATPFASPQATPQAFTLVNLNTATSDELLAIPNMNNRMVREFEEYRPYTSIEQFRAEIGKYVDSDVVTAWEAYVYVPIDPNSADVETLKQIPGVTDEIAQQLIDGRDYADNQAFIDKLATLLTQDQADYAANYLVEEAE